MPRIAPTPNQLSEVYIDESSQTKHRYLGLAGLIVHIDARPTLEVAIERARLPELPSGEMKWTKVSAAKLPAYKRVVDILFDGLSNVAPLHFHSLMIDTHGINDRQHNNGSRDIGFNKEVFQLAMKFGRLYPHRLFHVYPDHRDTSSSPEELRLILNRASRKKGDKRDWPFRRIHFRDSKKTAILQMTDVLLGALLFQLNGHHKAVGASAAKFELSKHVIARAGISDVFRDCKKSPYTVWHRQLK